jgi:hypothetical protein
MRETRNEYKVLVGNFERKRPPGMLRRRCEDNVTVDLEEI